MKTNTFPFLPLIIILAVLFAAGLGAYQLFLDTEDDAIPSSQAPLTPPVAPPSPSVSGYTGTRFAGSAQAPLLVFNEADYNAALASSDLVVLYFYANWCPICRAEFPKMEAAFNELTGEGVVGFRVNYNDNETDDAERKLASEFGVAYQHTKVFVKNGERVLKSPESWETSRYLSEIASYR